MRRRPPPVSPGKTFLQAARGEANNIGLIRRYIGSAGDAVVCGGGAAADARVLM